MPRTVLDMVRRGWTGEVGPRKPSRTGEVGPRGPGREVGLRGPRSVTSFWSTWTRTRSRGRSLAPGTGPATLPRVVAAAERRDGLSVDGHARDEANL